MKFGLPVLLFVGVASVWLNLTQSVVAQTTKLPIREGLQLWLNASAQRELREVQQLAPVSDGDPLDYWCDGSGHGRNCNQRLPEARPRLRANSSSAFVSFDGNNDFLGASNLRQSFTNITIFILGAPRSNAGFFRGFFAMSRAGANDFTSGLTIDLGGAHSSRFETLNPEGFGFGGAVDVMNASFEFGEFHAITVASRAGAGGIETYIDGQSQKQRDRAPSLLRMDELTVGARCYSNTPEPPHTQGFLHGAIAEVIVYDRILSSDERRAVEEYLLANVPGLTQLATQSNRKHGAWVTVTNPPPVQVFQPGFSAHELPLDLPNINNLKYRADGKLVAAGYNGQVFLLSDTDGDAVQDRAEFFWDRETVRAPIGLALTPPGYSRGQGVFLPGKGKLALIVDTNADDRADQEIVVASWVEPSLQHGVDALGVAVAADGSIYFGLGCANFTDAYLIDRTTGESRYSTTSERGTILRVTPDFSRREIVCTGIRFPVAIAFNELDDLFCTDQEGATWLSNGNPFDELLHIRQGRHYGFPPRHPSHLPNVIDEPSVYDYTPQHQSTCGLNFNEPVNGGPAFGPASWDGDALVTGYSRGKLYRTKLIKTDAGYVAKNQLVASLNKLAADACVSPQGDLVVATHSGQPDWGSGPTGRGKLYRIRYADTNAPQPVLVWAASPSETRIAFDRPLQAAALRDLARHVIVEGGKFVEAGDRFEALRPGYQVVRDQQNAVRHELPVLSANVSGDRRTLIITTAPRAAVLNYAVTLPAFHIRIREGANGFTNASKNDAVTGGPSRPAEISQHATVDLCHDVTGLEAFWRASDGKTNWVGWLPHPDLKVARAFTGDSSEHDALWHCLHRAGTLTLRGQLDLDHMLRPAVQPGSKIDYELPSERVTVSFRSTRALSLKAAGANVTNSWSETTLTVEPKPRQPVAIELQLDTGERSEPTLEVSWHTAEDARPRALPLRRVLLPWTKPDEEINEEAPGERSVPELAGGNWLRGQRIFFSEQAACAKCHQVQGRGGKIGPDLSNLVHRDYASVLKDIREPSAALNPDHLSYNVELADGDLINGVLLADARDGIQLGDVAGKTISISRSRVKTLQPSAISLMPEGLDAALGPDAMRDLLTFLLVSPLQPAPIEAKGPPPPRTWIEVGETLRQVPPLANELKPLRVLLVAGPKDHGPGEHDYPLWQKRWARLLPLADEVTVSTAMGWPSAEQRRAADVMVFYSNNPGWSADRAKELDDFQQRGGGLVYLHYAVDGHGQVEALSERIGLAWRGGQSRFRHGLLELTFTDSSHPITRGFGKTRFVDESYWNLVGDPTKVQLLASGSEEGQPQPLFWAYEHGPGRVFVSILGHYNWTFDDPLFRVLILRGICWVARQSEDRLSELATVGARIAP